VSTERARKYEPNASRGLYFRARSALTARLRRAAGRQQQLNFAIAALWIVNGDGCQPLQVTVA